MRIDPARNPLRRARLAANLELRELEKRTRISPAMLRHIDNGEFHRLPAGIYARSWVRTVAEAVGLDPAEVLSELDEALPKTGDAAAEKPPSEGGGRDRNSPAGRERMDQAPQPAAEGLSWLDRWRRSAVSVLDGIFLCSIGIVVWVLTAAAAGVDPRALGPLGALAVTTLSLLVGTAYFVLFAGIGGRTPGAALLALPAEETPDPLDLAEIGRRAAQAAVQESSILVDFMIQAELPPAVEHRRVRV